MKRLFLGVTLVASQVLNISAYDESVSFFCTIETPYLNGIL